MELLWASPSVLPWRSRAHGSFLSPPGSRMHLACPINGAPPRSHLQVLLLSFLASARFFHTGSPALPSRLSPRTLFLEASDHHQIRCSFKQPCKASWPLSTTRLLPGSGGRGHARPLQMSDIWGPTGTSESTCPGLNLSFTPLQHTKFLSAHPCFCCGSPHLSISLTECLLLSLSSAVAWITPMVS